MLTSDPWSRGPFYSFSCRASSAERKPTTSKHTAAPVRWLAALVQKAIWIDARRKAPVLLLPHSEGIVLLAAERSGSASA